MDELSEKKMQLGQQCNKGKIVERGIKRGYYYKSNMGNMLEDRSK